MTEEELYDRIQSEASQHIPFDIADVNLDYQLLEATENQMDVLLVAVKKDKILNHTNVLAQAGKTPVVVDIDAFALQNCFRSELRSGSLADGRAAEHRRQRDEHQYRPRLDAAVYSRRFGGRQPIHRRAAEGTGPELRGCRTAEDGRNTSPASAEEQRTAILRSVSDILILEIQKTFDFFRATASGENIRRIVRGRRHGARPGLDGSVAEKNSPCRSRSCIRSAKSQSIPARHDESQIRELAPRLAIAVGLALRSFDTP